MMLTNNFDEQIKNMQQLSFGKEGDHYLRLKSGEAQRTDTFGTAGTRRIAIAT